jgi:hypothetical protein
VEDRKKPSKKPMNPVLGNAIGSQSALKDISHSIEVDRSLINQAYRNITKKAVRKGPPRAKPNTLAALLDIEGE